VILTLVNIDLEELPMLLFLLLLIVAGAAVALYASQNTATHDVTLWQWHWSAVPDWVPVVFAAAVIAGLFVLYMLYSGLVHGVRVGSMRRRVSTRESALNDLRRENQRLREENARVRSELHGMDRGVASGEAAVATPTSADRPRVVAPYRPGSTFGERVRAFFGGREPAGS
jgi:uncharacterized integral membrane protein